MALPETAIAMDIRISKQPTKTYKLDFENKRIVGKRDGLEAMVQAVRKILTTTRYAERIYSGDYGTEIETMIGKPYNYIKAKARMLIEDAISTDDRIKGIKQIEIEKTETDQARITVNIATEYGEITIEHTIEG